MSHLPYNVEVGMTDEPGDIVAFIRARFDADETAAEFVDGLLSDLAPPPPRDPAQPVVFLSPEQYVVGSGILTEDRIRADVDAKRRILDELSQVLSAASHHTTVESCDELDAILAERILRLLALPYAAVEGYRGEWRP